MNAPVFVGCGFAAKYPEGGGNFSVPLQYLTGLKRMEGDGFRGVWLEVLQESGDPEKDSLCIRTFQRRMAAYGLEYCLLLKSAQKEKGPEEHHLKSMKVFGMPIAILKRLAPHATLLNLSYSIKPPLAKLFGRRLLCSLDPTEVLFWMDQIEMGQSCHDEFWSIGLCMDLIQSCSSPCQDRKCCTSHVSPQSVNGIGMEISQSGVNGVITPNRRPLFPI